MKTTTKTLTQRPAWKALAAHHKKIKNLHLRKLFDDDAKRGERMTASAAGLFLDYSKNRITDQTIKLLVQLANESDLRGRIAAMFAGESIRVRSDEGRLWHRQKMSQRFRQPCATFPGIRKIVSEVLVDTGPLVAKR